MKNISVFKKYIIDHKIISLILTIIISFSGYYGYKYFYPTVVEVKYIVALAKKGTIISSITGSGQVSAYNQVDIKPKASGEIVWIDLKVGQTVSAGQALAGIDNTDAKKAVSDAELDLVETKLNFDKQVAQAPIDYDRKLESLQSNKDDLLKAYDDSFNAISNAFLDLPNVITGIEDVLYGEELSPQSKDWNISAYKNMFDKEDRDLIFLLADAAEKDYKIARSTYDKNFNDFRTVTRFSDNSTLEKMLEQTLETSKLIAQAIKSENNLLDTVIDINGVKNRKTDSSTTAFKSNLKNYLGTANNHISSLLSQKSSLVNLEQTITNTERDIKILEINNPTGITPIDLQISKNNIAKKEVSLVDLKSKLADYTIRSPFEGIIAKVNAKINDTTSVGSAVATIVTKQKIVTITLNEVDISKIKIGQKATLVFDAIEGLSITGKVSEVDTLGTVSQGVVTYAVQISFDTQDERIKPGMSTSASIITGIKQDILTVPNGAIKSQSGTSYIEIFNKKIQDNGNTGTVSDIPPTKQNVVVGVSNDTDTEITEGLNEGDQIVVRTNTSTTKTTTAASSIKLPGMGGGGR
ncbi:MAG: efflux RND transporter periplasmic adaptor subunit [bacterium]